MSWEQLTGILQENRGYARQAMDPPVACPIDGDLLEIRADGGRNCPMGNYRWTGGQGVRIPS